MTVTRAKFWRIGDLFVQDDVVLTDEGVFLYETNPPPHDATDITEEEFAAGFAAFTDAWVADAEGGQAFVDQVVADTLAARSAAQAKLVAGEPLTPEEAAAL